MFPNDVLYKIEMLLQRWAVLVKGQDLLKLTETVGAVMRWRKEILAQSVVFGEVFWT